MHIKYIYKIFNPTHTQNPASLHSSPFRTITYRYIILASKPLKNPAAYLMTLNSEVSMYSLESENKRRYKTKLFPRA
jgi:hypothetical protein